MAEVIDLNTEHASSFLPWLEKYPQGLQWDAQIPVRPVFETLEDKLSNVITICPPELATDLDAEEYDY